MASQQLNITFATALEEIYAAFADTEKAIRKSKAAIHTAECRLRNAKKEFKRILDSLKEDVAINVSMNDSTDDDIFLDLAANMEVKSSMDDSGIIGNQDNSSDYGGTTDECEDN